MSNEPLTAEEQEIVREGRAAADLLANPDLQSVIKALMVEAFSGFTESKPDQLAQREQHYNLIRGLKAIEAELEARVQRKDVIQRRLDADDREETDAAALIDDADFGIDP